MPKNAQESPISRRLRQVLRDRSVRQFARELGLNYGTVHEYFAYGRMPSGKFLARLQEKEAVSPLWVMTGKEPKLVRTLKEETKAEDELVGAELVSGKGEGLDKEMAQLNAQLDEVLRFLRTHWPSQWVPKLALSAVAGELALDFEAPWPLELWTEEAVRTIFGCHVDLAQVDLLLRPEALTRYGRLFAIPIDGDSMESELHEGDLVFVSPEVPAQSGDIAVFQRKGQTGLLCKRLDFEGEDVVLVSLNPDPEWPKERVPRGDILWALKVLDVRRGER